MCSFVPVVTLYGFSFLQQKDPISCQLYLGGPTHFRHNPRSGRDSHILNFSYPENHSSKSLEEILPRFSFSRGRCTSESNWWISFHKAPIPSIAWAVVEKWSLRPSASTIFLTASSKSSLVLPKPRCATSICQTRFLGFCQNTGWPRSFIKLHFTTCAIMKGCFCNLSFGCRF